MAKIDHIREALKSIGEIPEAAAPDCAVVIDQHLRRTAGAGQTPTGVPWAPRKSDGAQALQNVNANLFIAAYGSTIYVRLTGPEVRHHRGWARAGTPQRQVIPLKKDPFPPAILAGMKAVLDKHFEKAKVANG